MRGRPATAGRRRPPAGGRAPVRARRAPRRVPRRPAAPHPRHRCRARRTGTRGSGGAASSRSIHEESTRIDQLLRDFQQLARHRAPQLAAIDPAEPLDRALQMLLAGVDEVRVRRRLTHGNCRVSGDADLLRQLWMNLVRNALDAIGEQGGTLWIDPGAAPTVRQPETPRQGAGSRRPTRYQL